MEGVIENADDHRLPLEQAIHIAKETCLGLEFAHAEALSSRGRRVALLRLVLKGYLCPLLTAT